MARAASQALLLLTVCTVIPGTRLPAQELEAARWLTGCWTAASGGTEVEEVWLAPKGGIMIGVSRTVREGVATGYELLRLHAVRGELVLSAHPSGQRPADFRISDASRRRLRFENPSHDFPKVIEYERVAVDSLWARVFGEVGSSAPSFILRYGRTTCEEAQPVG